MKHFICIITSSVAFIMINQTTEADKTVLQAGALLELSHDWFGRYYNFFVDIIEHAFEEIENRTDLLRDYSLKLIPKDTKGLSGLAGRRLFELMTEEPPVVAVLGPSLSPELSVVGQITPAYNTLHLSYVATTSSTVDREMFSTMFKVNQILDDLNPLRIKMMQYFGWRRVGTIFFGDDINASHMNLFHELLKQYNFTLITSAVISEDTEDLTPLIARLLQFNVRIIMASFRNTKAKLIFCEAYKQGLFGSQFVWILPGPGLHEGWISRIDFSELDCSYEQFVQATNGHITLNYDRFDTRNVTTISGSTPSEVKAYFEARVAQTDYILSSSFAWVYDTAWSLAVGLNHSLKYLNDSGLHNYTNDEHFLNAIMKGMMEVKFQGASGPVSFDAAGSRAGNTFIEQNFNETRIRVAMYDQATGDLNWFVPPESLWPHGSIPADRFTYRSVMIAPSLPSLMCLGTANTICMVVAIGFLSFNIYYRKNSNIKLSSPMINNIIIAGSLLMYTCVFFTAFDYGQLLPKSLDDHICMVRIWTSCLGFTAVFGALFSKTWRVHKIFRDYKMKKTIIKDWHLFGLIVVLMMIDCILLVSWSCIHSLQKTRHEKKTMDALDHNHVISEVYTFCHHPKEGYWFVSVYIYKGLLLVFGTFLAWETRHVTVPALNDSKYIGFCIYNVIIVCMFGVPLMHVLPREQTTLNFVLLSAFVIFCTTMCLCILFVPKIKMRNKVDGKFLLPSLNERTATTSNKSGFYQGQQKGSEQILFTEGSSSKENESVRGDTQTTDDMKIAIQKLRRRIADDTVSLEKLKQELHHAVISKSPDKSSSILVPKKALESDF